MHRLDWEDLRHFVAFAQGGTLSAAARALHVDHATVARRLRALEEGLGLPLIDRRGRRFVLTPAGTRIAQLAGTMAETAFAIERAARGASEQLTGTVSVSAPPVLTSEMILPALGPFHRQHPGITLNMIGEIRQAALGRREADLALRLSRPREEGVVARKIGELAFGLYARADYLAGRAAADYGFIAGDDSMDEAAQQRWLFTVAAGRAITLRTTLLTGQKAAAIAGFGIAALPHFMAADTPALLRLTDAEPAEIRRDIWLMVHEDLRHTPLVQAVMAFLATCLSQDHTRLGQPAG
jgi:DNA-binding transcriptional LysR family regulator